MSTRATWSAAYVDALPDSAFACIDSAGRHYPHHDAQGNVDLPHLRNALARVAQSGTAECGGDALAHLQHHAQMMGVGESALPASYERRVFVQTWPGVDMDIRATREGLHFSGYAAVFNSPSEPIPFIERIRPGAFSQSIRDRSLKKMFLNHEQIPVLASTKRTLKLSEDQRGLLTEADLPDNEWGRPVADAIRRGDIDSMSFGFEAKRDAWSADREERELIEVTLFEVSIVTGFPAYQGTSAGVRNIVIPTVRSFAQREQWAKEWEALSLR